MKYFRKYKDWSFGIMIQKHDYAYSKYTEYEFRIDFYKWSFGIVW